MALKIRVGFFFMFCGGLALLVFWASLKASEQPINLAALLIGAASLLVGLALANSKPSAPPPEAAEEAPPPPPPAPKKRRGLSGLFRQPPPPSPPPPAPPVKKKARRGLFRPQ